MLKRNTCGRSVEFIFNLILVECILLNRGFNYFFFESITCYVLRPFALATLRQTLMTHQPEDLFISGCSTSGPKTKKNQKTCEQIYACLGLFADTTEQTTFRVHIIHQPDAVDQLWV